MIFLSQDKELMGYRLLDACPFLAHFVTTRQGGVSQGNYASFNCSPYTHDTCMNVWHNQSHLFRLMKDILCAKHPSADQSSQPSVESMGLDSSSADQSLQPSVEAGSVLEIRELVLPHQTHGCECSVIDANYFRLSAEARREQLEGVDALITNQPGVCIGITTADCVPVLLCDTKHRVVAAIHAGWKGTVQHIVARTLQRLQTEFGTEGADVIATIGPSISFRSFEVGDEVVEAFRKAGFPMDEADAQSTSALFESDAQRASVESDARTASLEADVQRASVEAESKPLASRHPQTGKYHIDLWEANRMELLQAGVPAAQIEVAGICTYQHPEQFFSARRLGINSGRILSGIMIR